MPNLSSMRHDFRRCCRSFFTLRWAEHLKFHHIHRDDSLGFFFDEGQARDVHTQFREVFIISYVAFAALLWISACLLSLLSAVWMTRKFKILCSFIPWSEAKRERRHKHSVEKRREEEKNDKSSKNLFLSFSLASSSTVGSYPCFMCWI